MCMRARDFPALVVKWCFDFVNKGSVFPSKPFSQSAFSLSPPRPFLSQRAANSRPASLLQLVLCHDTTSKSTAVMTTFRAWKWAPANETLATIEEERYNFAGISLGAVGYGVHATLYFYTLSFLLQSLQKRGYGPRRNARSIGTWTMIIYITTNFIIGSIGNAVNIKFSEEQFIDDRDFPGGPVAYSRAADSNKLNSIGFCLYVINTWLQDGLLLYRFWVIVIPKPWLFAIPGLSYLASIIMSILLLIQFTGHAAGFFSHAGVNFGLAFWSTSIGTTLFVTTCVVTRLLILRFRIKRVLLSKGHHEIYVSLSTVCIESAVLYTSVALVFIINYARNSPETDLMLPLLGQVQSIAPLLITLRLAQGRALTSQIMKDTLTEVESSLVMGPPSTIIASGLNQQDGFRSKSLDTTV